MYKLHESINYRLTEKRSTFAKHYKLNTWFNGFFDREANQSYIIGIFS